MPIINSSYKPRFYFKNGFIATVYSGLFRRVKLNQQRERLTLPDSDFIDLDWSFATLKSNKLIILLHGLEGHGQRPYITGAAKLFNLNGVDAVCVNFRGCSGTPNLKYKSYHSGETADLSAVIHHAISNKHYDEIYLKGVSLGGNIILKYLGTHKDLPNQIKSAVAVSVPCHLASTSRVLHEFKNKLYHDRFLKHILKSLAKKQKMFPDKLSISELNSINSLLDFDNVYTSKAHGFKNALDYYEQCSSLQNLSNIKTPVLIINALNDSFLAPESFPVKAAKNNTYLHLEMPKFGGHAGFIDKKNVYYNEKRALQFITENRLN